MFGDELRDIANFNNNLNLYCYVRKFYLKLKPKMHQEAVKGNYYISCMLYDFCPINENGYDALNYLHSLAVADNIEVVSDFPSSSLVNLRW